MEQRKGKKLTREEAGQLYEDLRKAMSTVMARKADEAVTKKSKGFDPKVIAQQISSALKGGGTPTPPSHSAKTNIWSQPRSKALKVDGKNVALMALIGCIALKVGLIAVEWSGAMNVEQAQASINSSATIKHVASQFTKEELQVLTALDQRRSELEDRRKRLDQREEDLNQREREFAVRLTQLKELSESLKGERDKSERKQEGQLDQLANVYGSMNPEESATLLGQLDVTIALSLLKRMPEKRIAQILSVMPPEKALMLTKMLSGK